MKHIFSCREMFFLFKQSTVQRYEYDYNFRKMKYSSAKKNTAYFTFMIYSKRAQFRMQKAL